MTGMPPVAEPPLLDIMQQGIRPRGIGINKLLRFETEQAGGNDPGLGIVASMGKGVVESMLGLGRAANWLGYKLPRFSRGESPFTDIPEEAKIVPGSLNEILSDKQALRLESRLARAPNIGPISTRSVAEMTGSVLPLTGAAGPVFGLPGKAIDVLGIPGAKLGSAILSKLPNAGKWTAMAKDVVPKVLGSSTGFGLYNYMNAEGGWDERSAAAAHGMVAGAGIAVLKKVADVAESALLGKLAKPATKANWLKVEEALTKGRIEHTLLDRAAAKAVGAAIEGTGFAMLDENWWSNVFKGVKGDGDAMSEALNTWFGSVAAMAVARGMNPMQFRRENAEANNFEFRAQSPNFQKQPGQGPQEPQKLLGWDPTQKGAPGEPAAEVAANLPAAAKVTDPLFKSGWELEPTTKMEGGKYDLKLSFPGSGTVTVTEDMGQTGPAAAGLRLRVPVDVFRAVRGDVPVPEGTNEINIEGQAADEFARDLAAVSILRRIRGEIAFGKDGEVWAGGPWRGEDGRMHTIGLDGKHYSQSLPMGDAWRLEDDPPLPVNDNGAQENPQIQRWLELAQALRENVAANPGMDLLESSLALALRGSPDSASVKHLIDFLSQPWQQGVLNADIAGSLLQPGNIEQFGLTVGQIAAGHLTAEAARQQIGTVLVGSPKGTELQAPQEPAGEPGAEGAPTEPPAGEQPSVAGQRDWHTAPGPERRAAARAYVEAERAAGRDVESTYLRDTFGVPRETARGIVKQAPAAEVKPTLEADKPSSSESGFVVADMLAAPFEAIAKGVEAAGRARDFAIENAADVVAKRGGTEGQELATRIKNVLSQTRLLIGRSRAKTRDAMKVIHKNSETLQKLVEVKGGKGGPYQQLAWIAGTEGKLTAKDPELQKALDAINASLLTLHNAFVDAGGMVVRYKDGNVVYEPAKMRDRATVQRVYSRKEKGGYSEVMGTTALMREFYDLLAKLNPELGLTGEKLMEIHQGQMKALGMDPTEKVAAVEIGRVIHHVPATFTSEITNKTYEILEPDPLIALHSIIENQGARVASVAEFGQDLPTEVHEQYPTLKPGVSAAYEKFAQRKTEGLVDSQKDLNKTAKALLERMQGREPEKLGRGLTLARDILTLPRALGAALSGLWDIPAMAVEPIVHLGLRRAILAAFDYVVSTGPKSANRIAEDLGTLQVELGHLDMGLATTRTQKAAEWISALSNLLERVKTGLFDRGASVLLRGWKAGHAHVGDKDIPKMLGMTAAEMDALVNNTATPELRLRLRHELVQLMTARGRKAERSQLAASPFWTTLMRYLGFGTKRLNNIGKEIKTYAKSAATGTLKEQAVAAKKLMYSVSGRSFGGALGVLLGALVAGLFKGRLDGGSEALKQMLEDPAKALVKGAIGQVLSGPFGTIASSAVDDPSVLVRLTELTQLAYATMNGIQRLEQAWSSGGSPWDAMVRGAEDIGVLPRQVRSVFTALQLASHGTKEMADLSDDVFKWKRDHNIRQGSGSLAHPREFYLAMRELKTLTMGHKDADGDLWERVKPLVTQALQMAPSDSVSAKIRSMRMLNGLNKKQVDALTTYMGDEKMLKINEHDRQIAQIARAAGQLDGEEQTPWSEAVTMAERQARLGGVNAWSDLMERTVDEMSRQIAQEQPVSSQWQELADAIARNPESITNDSTFTDNDKLALLRMTIPERVNYLGARLHQRAIASARSDRRKELEAAMKDAR